MQKLGDLTESMEKLKTRGSEEIPALKL